MTRRKQEKHHIRNLNKVGNNSYSVTLPIEIIREFGWQEHQKVTVKQWGNSMLISDWEK